MNNNFNNSYEKFYNLTTEAIQQLLALEEKRLKQNYNNNTAKNIKKIDFVSNLLLSVPSEVVFVVEGVRGNGDIRAFDMVNLGSVVECIIKYFLEGKPNKVYKSLYAKDTKKGRWEYEVKSSLSANSLATPSEKELTILVNHKGIFSLRKNEVLSYTNKQNRLPYNEACGTPLTALMDELGYDTIEC